MEAGCPAQRWSPLLSGYHPQISQNCSLSSQRKVDLTSDQDNKEISCKYRKISKKTENSCFYQNARETMCIFVLFLTDIFPAYSTTQQDIYIYVLLHLNTCSFKLSVYCHTPVLFQCLKADLCAACCVKTSNVYVCIHICVCVCVCVDANPPPTAHHPLMTNGWNEPSMGSQPCEVKCKIDIWEQLMHCGSQVCTASLALCRGDATPTPSPSRLHPERGGGPPANSPLAAGRMSAARRRVWTWSKMTEATQMNVCIKRPLTRTTCVNPTRTEANVHRRQRAQKLLEGECVFLSTSQ